MSIGLSGTPAFYLADTQEIPYLVARRQRGTVSALLHRARVAWHHLTYAGAHRAPRGVTHG